MGKKKVASASGEGEEQTPESSQTKYANELQILIDTIDPDDYSDDLGTDIWTWFTELEKFSSAAVKAGVTYGKTLRNRLVNEHLEGLLPIFSKFTAKIRERDANIYDLQTSIAGTDEALMRAKIWTLEKENAALKAKLDLNEDVASTLRDLLPKFEDLKANNTNVFKEELPSIIKQIACEDLGKTIKTANTELVEQVKINSNETRSFAQVALQAKSLPPGVAPTYRPPTSKPEGVFLIKPKDDTARSHETNKKIFVEALQKNNPEVRLRGIGKIHGGGIKLIAASLQEVQAVKDILLENCDEEVLEKYDIVIPNRKAPQIILYNVDKEVEEGALKSGLLAKSITLADGNNKPHFKIDFSIPARNTKYNHWVLSINPNKFSEIIAKEGLYFQFNRLRIKEFVSPRQCRKCFAFGHTTKNCDSKTEQRCDRCGDVRGKKHRCRGPYCINCAESNKKFRTNFRTEHSCLDPNCKSLIKQIDLIRQRTDYGI
ncbi:hypothetical protein AVEN_113655-1 [Araneus ventricosus]|uniref:CCHC-type domain-containing protein n=1 Tax=Araneus ventricosus TaxID=182803 RepID=A0A4Y2NRV7_ARAVE|nr:hypothetical protein AVEN_113655-1 [Araneus ventricosus]